MMTQRRVATLLIAALVVIALAFFSSTRRHGESHPASIGQPVLDGLKGALNDVTEVRISKGDGTHVTLKKRAADWAVAERDFAADSGKVRKLLLDLSALTIVEEKTSDAASYARIGVEDVKTPTATGSRVEAVTPKKTYAIIVGRPQGAKNSYVRAGDAKTSYLATPTLSAEADPKRWLDHALADIQEARIKDVAVKPATGPAYSVSREKKEQTDFTVANIPKGRELSSPGAANGTAGELMSLTSDDVRKLAAADAGAGAPSRAAAATGGKSDGAKAVAAAKTDAAKTSGESATFHTFDGLEIQVDGVKEGERHYIALAARSTAKESETEAQALDARVKGWQFEIPNYKYDQLFRPLEELLKKPEPKAADAKGAKKPVKAPLTLAPPAP